jgi:hypothetical protein
LHLRKEYYRVYLVYFESFIFSFFHFFLILLVYEKNAGPNYLEHSVYTELAKFKYILPKDSFSCNLRPLPFFRLLILMITIRCNTKIFTWNFNIKINLAATLFCRSPPIYRCRITLRFWQIILLYPVHAYVHVSHLHFWSDSKCTDLGNSTISKFEYQLRHDFLLTLLEINTASNLKKWRWSWNYQKIIVPPTPPTK